MTQPRQKAAELWKQYQDAGVIRKCEQFAQYTIPSLFVDPLLTTAQTIQHDFQSMGALLTNNLASKLVNSLFPAGVPFFKNVITREMRKAIEQAGNDVQEVQNILTGLELDAMERLLMHSSIAKLNRAVKLLIATGNVLLHRDTDESKLVVWSLRSFVVRRNARGEFRTIVLKQCFRFDELPQEVQADLAAKRPEFKTKPERTLDYYTVIEREPGTVNARVVVWNEVDGVRCGPESSYPEHLSPWIAATWNLADGEHYGRGLVEDFTGDFAKMSLVSEQLGLYELEALSLLNLVDEGAGGVVDDYQNADTGDFVRGKTAAVTSYERGDYNKINAVRESIGEVITRLSQAFMWTGNTRDAERVTAEEIKAIAREAEHTLGGVYSLLAEQLQVPLAYLTMREVNSAELLTGLVHKSWRPTILTGIPALTRNVAVSNLVAAVQEAAAIVPPLLQLDTRLDPQKLLDLIYQSRSVNTSDLFKSPERLAEEARAKQEAATQAQAAGAGLLGAAGAAQQETLQQI